MTTKNARASLSVTKPVKAWNKPLKADFRDFFKGLTKAIAHGAIGEWVSSGCDLADAVAAIGLKTEPGERAWILIRRALSAATWEVISGCSPGLLLHEGIEAGPLCDGLDFALEESDLTIDSSFFTAPRRLAILQDYQALLGKWLEAAGMNSAQADSWSQRTATHFVYALRDEWQKHPRAYQPLRDALEMPVTLAAEREQDWERYFAYLEKQVDESMLGEPFSLRQVYVPLRAYYVMRDPEKDEKDERESPGHLRHEERAVVQLHKEISRWLKEGTKADAIRIVSGGPGCGKSSFTKMLAAELAGDRSRRVLYIPLHLFDPSADLGDSVGNYVQGSGLLRHNPLSTDSGEQRILLLFDGLDELAMRGRGSQQVAHDFVSHLCSFVETRNTRELRVQALLAGRTVVVQANQTHFRLQGQILHALPYMAQGNGHTRYSERSRSPEEAYAEYGKGEELLEEDQRVVWWRAYGKATGRGYEGLPEELAREDLIELTGQPLLNYLIALSYGRGVIDFSDPVSLNRIYEDMLKAVYDRAYGGGTHVSVKEMDYGSFVRVLEEIALAAWHGDGRTTTVKEIENHCKSAGLTRLLGDFQEGAEAGVGRLLTAFYFRQHGQAQDGERSFEFTHKSFGEYLAARRLVRALRKIDVQTQRHNTDPDDGWDLRETLRHWLELTGPTTMDRYLYTFIQKEIGLAGPDEKECWQPLLLRLIGHLLRHGFPFEGMPRQSQRVEASQARNAGEALLAVLCSVSDCTEEVSLVDWPEPTSAGAWIRELQGQRSGPESVLAMACLTRLSFVGQELHGVDMYGASLSHSDFDGVYARNVWLECAILRSVRLRQAYLHRADLEGADLEGADLEGADLEGADLEGANLEGANLEGAKLEGANLEGANLDGANLEGAKLKGAKLKGAKLGSGAPAHLRRRARKR